MRGAVALLMLLFCLSGAWTRGEIGGRTQGEIGGSRERDITVRGELLEKVVEVLSSFTETVEITHPSQRIFQPIPIPDVWAELKELRDMVVEQRVELRNMEARLKESEDQGNDLKAELQINKKKVELLEKENADRQRVAFSASLTDSGHVGPFDTDTNLIFTKVFTNVGEAYNSTTGLFTAPVRGVYYFRFTAMDNRGSNKPHGVQLLHNNQRVLLNQGRTHHHASGYYFSNALILTLDEGDVVNMRLPSKAGIFDNTNTHTTFSGFLIFPV